MEDTMARSPTVFDFDEKIEKPSLGIFLRKKEYYNKPTQFKIIGYGEHFDEKFKKVRRNLFLDKDSKEHICSLSKTNLIDLMDKLGEYNVNWKNKEIELQSVEFKSNDPKVDDGHQWVIKIL